MTDPLHTGEEVDLAAKLGELVAEVRQLRESDARLAQAVEKLRDGNRPEWSTYIAGGSLLLLIGTLTFSPVYRSITAIQEHQTRFDVLLLSLARDETRVDERLAGLEGKYGARREEVNRRFVEDVATRMDRMESRNLERFDRLRIWVTTLEREVDQHYREVAEHEP